MKTSIFVVIAFIIGIICGKFELLPESIARSQAGVYTLWILIFLVAIGIGSNIDVWKIAKRMHFKIVLVPLSVITGTLLGAGIFSIFLPDITMSQSLAVGSGFGYYSLSSVIISQLDGETLGLIALISNLIREIVTLLISPVFARFFGRLAPIASGGATTMDTTLPIITRVCGKDYAVIAIFSGMVLTILVPFLVPLLLRLQ